MMAQSIPNVPIPPKGFFKCRHPLSFSTSEQERTKLLKLSSVAKPFNSNHFCEIYLQLWKETAPLLGKKSFFHPCVALKCWKCFAIILHNVKYRHTVLSTFLTHTYEISKPLTKIKFSKIIWDYWWWLTQKPRENNLDLFSLAQSETPRKQLTVLVNEDDDEDGHDDDNEGASNEETDKDEENTDSDTESKEVDPRDKLREEVINDLI